MWKTSSATPPEALVEPLRRGHPTPRHRLDRHLIEAAKDLGATEFQTVRRVDLPLLMPAVAAGWLLSFTLSMDDVMVSFFVTGPTFEILPLKIYSMVRLGVTPEINALCTIMLGVTLTMILIAQLLLREKA